MMRSVEYDLGIFILANNRSGSGRELAALAIKNTPPYKLPENSEKLEDLLDRTVDLAIQYGGVKSDPPDELVHILLDRVLASLSTGTSRDRIHAIFSKMTPQYIFPQGDPESMKQVIHHVIYFQHPQANKAE